MVKYSPLFFIRRMSSILWSCGIVLCSLMLISAYSYVGKETQAIEVNMRITLEGQRSGTAFIRILSNGAQLEQIEGVTKEENLLFLKLGSVYRVIIGAPGYASKCLEFDATHPKAREGEFPCDIDLYESKESFASSPPVVGQISWNNFRKLWIHKVNN